MSDPLNEAYCCCHIFHITHGVFLIALHSFLQGIYGLLLVVTSYYRSKEDFINVTVITANICLFPAGILVFGTTLYDSHQAAKASALLFTVVSIFNFGAAICYIFWYSDFSANSQLDKVFFWRHDRDWVATGQLPFTIWHVLAFVMVVILIIWWYYSFQLWKYASLLKVKNETHITDSENFHHSMRFWHRKPGGANL